MPPNQVLPKGVPSGQADQMSAGTLSMACGWFSFLLLGYLYIITLVFINFVFSMNLVRLVQFESYQCGSLAPVR
jgi:hypothetical protein